MVKLPGGFSPVRAVQQVGSVVNPTGGTANYDVFSDYGNQRSDSGSSSNDQNEGATYYDGGTGTLYTYRSGSWVPSDQSQPMDSSAPASGGGSYSGPTLDTAAISMLEAQQRRTQDNLGRVGGQRDTALGNLTRQYTNERARLDNARIDTEKDYTTNRGNTVSDFAATKERIGENVRQNVNSLQRLFGARGAGSSSAAQIMAPYAAARAGTSEQAEAGRDYSENLYNLDTNWKRYDRDWQTSASGLDANRGNQENEVKQGFATKEADLYNTLAEIQQKLAAARGGGRVDTSGIEARISQLLNEIDALGARNFGEVVKANDPRYEAPELKDYNVETRGVEGAEQDPTYQETQAFYPVREDEEDKFLQSLYA